ncbi:hypothetical protein U1Q18_048356 [Sarracenia purpurea var. burkii]
MQKNVDQPDDLVAESSAPLSSANQLVVPNERPIATRKSSNVSEIGAMTDESVPLEVKRRRSSELSGMSMAYDHESKYSSPSNTPGNECRSRRNSSATVVSSSTGEFQNELARSFFDEGHGPESGSESSKNQTPTHGYDDLNGGGSFNEQCEGTEPHSSSWYTNAWELFGQKSLGYIIDTMNEILSRPEVSSCSSESVDLFREEMMMFQHFGREISAIDKQEDESKQDEETTTLIDLDEISGRVDNKAKSKIISHAGCSTANTLECDICDQTFSDPSALQSHISFVHANEGIS